jgi:prepilin-type processing-associated H-X9-DG protein
MKQLGLAVANYESSTGAYAMSYATRNTQDTNTWSTWGSWSPQAQMLGYLEQGVVYNATNFVLHSHCCQAIPPGSSGCGDNDSAYANATSITTRINSFLCPSSPLPYTTYFAKPMPGNSYFGSVGSSMHWMMGIPGSAPNGLFGYGGGQGNDDARPLGVRDVTDGTSNTIAFGEWRLGDQDSSKLSIQDVISHGPGFPSYISGEGWGDPNMNMQRANWPAFQNWLNVCAGLAPASTRQANNWEYNMSYLGQAWNQGMFGWTLGNTLMPPNSPYPNCRGCGWDGDWDCPGMYGLSSFHPGGGNVAFADGSVRFLKTSTSQFVVWALGSRSGDEVVSSDSY